MPSTYTTNLGIELPADGELDGVWGDVVNDNMSILDRAINGSVTLPLSGTSSTLTTTDGTLSDGQFKLLVLGGAPSGTHTVTIAPNNAQKIYLVQNETAQSVVFTQGSGGDVTLAAGDSGIIYSDGGGASAAVFNLTNDFAMDSVKITGGSINGAVIGGSSAEAGTFTTLNASGDVSVADKIVHSGDTDTAIRFPAADTVAVETSGAERLRVTSAGNVGIGTASPAASLDVAGTGAIKVPVGTAAQRPTAATGMFRFNNELGKFEGYTGTEWGSVGGGATSDAIYENSATITEDITIVTGRNGMSTGPITVNSGVTVTVESGARYVVL